MLFLGVALFLIGGAVGAELLAALGIVTALSTVLVWSYVGGAIDRVVGAGRGVRTTLGVWRLTLGEWRSDRSGAETDGQRRAVERLQQRYAEDELTEREFEEQMELVLETDDDEVAEMLVETEE